MSKNMLKGMILMFLCVKTVVVSAQPTTLNLSAEVSNYDIGKSTTFFEDKSGKLSFEQILAIDKGNKFMPSPKSTLNFGVTSSSIWVKFKAQNKAYPLYSRWILMIDYALFDYVHLYQQGKNEKWVSQRTGDMYPFSERLIPHNQLVFPLNMPDSTERTYYLRFKTTGSMQIGMHIKSETFFLADSMVGSIGHGLFFGGLLIMLFYNLFLFFSLKDKSYLAYVFFLLNNVLLQATFSGYTTQYILGDSPYWSNHIVPLIMSTTPIVMALFTILFLNTKYFAPIIHKTLVAIIVLSSLNFMLSLFVKMSVSIPIAGVLVMVVSIFVFLAAVISLRGGNKAARFFLIAWGILIVAALSNSLRNFGLIPPTRLAQLDVKIASILEVVLLSMALADKYNLFKRDKEVAQLEILTLHENANKELDLKVTERTAELNQSLTELKATQAQLIQAEKMASLGELTAGIAHEIQNPLNFVNNFSEVSGELVDELNEELEKGDLEEVKFISNDLKANLQKINHHGLRASSIVKGMLEHSRKSSGKKELTDINALADEYLRLAYHGLRAKDPTFQSDFSTDFEDDLPKIEVVSQDIGRVLLNLINNAFQACAERSGGRSRRSAVHEKAQEGIDGYKPNVTVSTKLSADGQLLIVITDNGPGIPDAIKDKIFQPFFTTKDTGKGTGLGLSLAYDIVKVHGGIIEVNSVESNGTEFVVKLPIS